MSSSTEDCIFCNKANCKVISSTKHFFIIRDTAYPVTKHHTLIITNRHVCDYFDLNKYAEFSLKLSNEFPFLYGAFAIILAVVLGALMAWIRKIIHDLRYNKPKQEEVKFPVK